jgi:hypothetical protein
MDLLKTKAQKFDNLETQTGKRNALAAIREYKQLEADCNMFSEMINDKWHPLPEVDYQEVVFDKEPIQKDEEQK